LEVLDRVHAFVTVRGDEALPSGTPTLRCRFVHVLYQNTFYASLRATRRTSLSTAVANALIEFHGPDNSAVASEVAVLLEAARDRLRAAGYFLIACQNALRVFAFVEAAAIAERGLSLLSHLPDSPDRNAVELKLQVALGTAWVAIKGYAAPDVERAYGRARELIRQGGDSTALASVIFGLFVYYVVVPSHRTSLELGDEMLALAEREHSTPFRVQGLLMHGMTRTWMGDVTIAATHLEEGIALYDEARRAISGRTPLFDHGAGCRRYHAAALWLLGRPDQAARRATEAVADARELKHPLTLASTLSFESMVHYFAGHIEETEATAAEAVACTREYVLTFWCGFAAALHGWAVAQRASASGRFLDWEQGVAQIRESLEALRAAGARTFGSVGHALLGEAYMLRSRLDEAEAALNDGVALARAAEEGIWEAELHRLLGTIAIARGADDDAEAAFERAIKIARRRQQKMLELRALTSLDELVRRRNNIGRAQAIRSQLAATYQAFAEGFETRDLRQAKAALSAR
jgi:predicted ATPase